MRNGCDLPLRLADGGRFGQKIRLSALADFLLPGAPPAQKFLPGIFKIAGEFHKEPRRLLREDFRVKFSHWTSDFHFLLLDWNHGFTLPAFYLKEHTGEAHRLWADLDY